MSETSDHVPVAEPPPPPPIQSDMFLSLLCAVVGLALVAGLAMVAHQAWLWLQRSSTEVPPPSPPPPNGLKKKDLLALLKLSYEGAIAVASRRLADCAICLAEFEEGDEIRILPPCRHSFHVDCVNRWLGSHSSCPSCCRVVVVSAASS